MAKYGIKITYSNGDEEDGLYGNFASKEEAFKEICVLAAKEAYVQNEDFDELRTCSVYFDAYEYKADLTIHGAIIVCRNFPMLKEAMTASEALTKNLRCDFFSLPFWVEFFIIFL